MTHGPSSARRIERLAMNRNRIIRSASTACLLLALGGAAQAKGYTLPEPLPRFADSLTLCREAAQKLGHGAVGGAYTMGRGGSTYYVFESRERDGTPWLIACDASAARIVKAVGLTGI